MLPQIVLHSIHKLDLPDSAAIFMRKNTCISIMLYVCHTTLIHLTQCHRIMNELQYHWWPTFTLMQCDHTANKQWTAGTSYIHLETSTHLACYDHTTNKSQQWSTYMLHTDSPDMIQSRPNQNWYQSHEMNMGFTNYLSTVAHGQTHLAWCWSHYEQTPKWCPWPPTALPPGGAAVALSCDPQPHASRQSL